MAARLEQARLYRSFRASLGWLGWLGEPRRHLEAHRWVIHPTRATARRSAVADALSRCRISSSTALGRVVSKSISFAHVGVTDHAVASLTKPLLDPTRTLTLNPEFCLPRAASPPRNKSSAPTPCVIGTDTGTSYAYPYSAARRPATSEASTVTRYACHE